MLKIEHLFNYQKLGAAIGINPASLRSLVWKLKNGKMKGSKIVDRATENLNNLLCNYLAEDHYEVLRVMAIAETAISDSEILFYDSENKIIYLRYESGTKTAEIKKEGALFNMLCTRLFGKI